MLSLQIHEEVGDKLFSVDIGDKTMSKGLKLQQRTFRLGIKKINLLFREQHWNRSPREVMEPPSMDVKSRLDKFGMV